VRQTFADHENSAGEQPGARGQYGEPPSHSPRCGCARGCRHAGGHEQRLQDQPTCVVRSDVHSAAPHKNRARLTPQLTRNPARAASAPDAAIRRCETSAGPSPEGRRCDGAHNWLHTRQLFTTSPKANRGWEDDVSGLLGHSESKVICRISWR